MSILYLIIFCTRLLFVQVLHTLRKICLIQWYELWFITFHSLMILLCKTHLKYAFGSKSYYYIFLWFLSFLLNREKPLLLLSLFFKYILFFLLALFWFFLPSKFWVYLEFNWNNVWGWNPSMCFLPGAYIFQYQLLNKPSFPTDLSCQLLSYTKIPRFTSGLFILLHRPIYLLMYQYHEVLINSTLPCILTSGRASLTH